MSTHELPAGREMDALIYTDVMGAEYSRVLATNEVFAHIPHYSTDIAAAWLVVEKMAAEGFEYEVHGQTWGGREIGRYVWFHKGDLSGQSARNDSTPGAICRAALAALTEGTP